MATLLDDHYRQAKDGQWVFTAGPNRYAERRCIVRKGEASDAIVGGKSAEDPPRYPVQSEDHWMLGVSEAVWINEEQVLKMLQVINAYEAEWGRV